MRRAGIEAVVLLWFRCLFNRSPGWKGTTRFDGSTVMRRHLSVKCPCAVARTR